jgi:hypothetical protein
MMEPAGATMAPVEGTMEPVGATMEPVGATMEPAQSEIVNATLGPEGASRAAGLQFSSA